MATMFKTFLNDDVTTTRTLLHEAIPIHGGIVFGTYPEPEDDAEGTNIKNYPHKMFQSVYDYPYLRSSANHIFDMTLGLSGKSELLNNQDTSYLKKARIYTQMAQVLAGHNTTGGVLRFDADGDILEGGTKYDELYVISLARLLNKDEIKKGSFHIHLDVGQNPFEQGVSEERKVLYISDASDNGSINGYRVNSPAGDYGILRCKQLVTFGADGVTPTDTIIYGSSDTIGIDERCGLIYYQAGVVVLSPHVFNKYASPDVTYGKLPGSEVQPVMHIDEESAAELDIEDVLQQVDIPTSCSSLRRRIVRLAFNNTTELNSTIYFCRVNHNDFNYSSNPTYLKDSKIRVKDSTEDAPISYISSVGLYSSDNELLAVAKLSEVLRKDPTNEMVLRVRLDY